MKRYFELNELLVDDHPFALLRNIFQAPALLGNIHQCFSESSFKHLPFLAIFITGTSI
jgi:hypothetical protein